MEILFERNGPERNLESRDAFRRVLGLSRRQQRACSARKQCLTAVCSAPEGSYCEKQSDLSSYKMSLRNGEQLYLLACFLINTPCQATALGIKLVVVADNNPVTKAVGIPPTSRNVTREWASAIHQDIVQTFRCSTGQIITFGVLIAAEMAILNQSALLPWAHNSPPYRPLSKGMQPNSLSQHLNNLLRHLRNTSQQPSFLGHQRLPQIQWHLRANSPHLEVTEIA